MTSRVVVLDIVGLTPNLLKHMPAVSALGERGFRSRLDTVLPAVTCTVQSTLLTGELPATHGVVANGWYFRDLGEVMLWRQHNALVGGEKIWDAARAQDPDYKVANVCWWYAMGADVDWTVTPRPVYYSDGRKEPDCYTWPPALHDELTDRLGEFPLFTYWGPNAGMPSTQWILAAARQIFDEKHPDLTLVYIPHLDYEPQRSGPDSPATIRAARQLDDALRPLIDHFLEAGATVVALSEYGIAPASRPVDINRALRRAGLLEVHTQDGMEYLDPWTSRAFAVADHQLAHVYVKDRADTEAVAKIVRELDGVGQVLDAEGKRAHGLDHERSGELVAIADHDAWFTYYYWLDDERAPDFARQVEIHRKPGYDPAELLYDEEVPAVKLRAVGQVARKKLGFRYRIQTVPLDPSGVRGSHGRLPADAGYGPVLLCSEPERAKEVYAATEVKSLLLGLAGLDAPGATTASG
ncbi:putative AlkP superfamily pyrophosphatase or phosphodiesterase [Streptomyces sp. SAI-144]|uniref:alkaline phosphatase family protein n=1 Tax=unclassified Streptomyces TaxID=2593676 RepID=UPI002475A85D|nr:MULTISPECIES: nucleotide pyrophosphatase/phosphodiesterase family protein [unclassified Streptomyces]MDH6438785.1 putative AlkP superfamily pyrophosphatase or phosphodiesterase [Streptomyces sp. SAI-144]MDH6486182.1 putative AlkP superfamily pyrophosphatase or phosphodiesterase [Streptomyces sp. SAI-127]